MEIRYQRELKHNYLVVSPDADGEQFYELHMLAENRIKGLLNMHVKYSEEGLLYYYEITSKQPLSRLLENKGMKGEEIIKLITGISAVLDSLEVFLLKEEDIWLVPDQIYIEPEDSQVFLCLIPGLKNDFPDAMRELLQFLLGKVDHRDKEGVVLAYGLFQESQKENYGIKDLMKVIGAADEEASGGEEKEQPSDIREESGKEKEGWTAEELDGQEEQEEVKKDGGGRPYAVFMIGTLAALALCLCFAWIRSGRALPGGYLLIGIGLLAAVAAAYLALKENFGKEREKREKKEAPEKKRESGNSDSWIMELEGDDEKEEKQAEEEKKSEARQLFPTGETTLLADLEKKKDCRKLVSLEKDGGEIRIPYFPFLIGKQEGLVDWTLNCDTVSRLHLRIDEEGGKYKVTDLNSTNGTSVKGRMLEANESAEITPGDQIYIADKGYLFI